MISNMNRYQNVGGIDATPAFHILI